MSHSTLSGAQAASGYYKAEIYYSEGTKNAERAAEYFGQGASEAGLTGTVDDKTFGELLDGQTPDGRLMGRIRNGEREHRAGMDLTFSAPKGVSVAGLVAGDDRVLEAHREAVKETVSYIEKHAVQFRQVEDGETVVKTGGKIIAGLFQHETSRALDPQLHTHVVVANMVKGEDGQYRALHNDQIVLNTRWKVWHLHMRPSVN